MALNVLHKPAGEKLSIQLYGNKNGHANNCKVQVLGYLISTRYKYRLEKYKNFWLVSLKVIIII